MRTIALACVLTLVLCAATGCKSSDRVANFDAMLDALDKHNVAYRGKVTGPTAGHFQLYSGGQFGSGGWVDIEIGNSALTQTPDNDTTPDAVATTATVN